MKSEFRFAGLLCALFFVAVIASALVAANHKADSIPIPVPARPVLVADSNLYPETAIVHDITDDVVTVETYSGNLFAFVGAEDYEVNDVVSMLMYDNDTPEVYDDGIVKVQYSGRV